MSEPQKSGFFKRVASATKDAYREVKAQEQAAKDTEKQFYAEAAEKYGRLVASELFDGRRIELFDDGYVRVGGFLNRKGGPKPKEESSIMDSRDYVVAYDAPFERLRGIRSSTQIQDKSAGGRAVASAASLGLSEMASNEKRYLFLTISTDQETYTLKEKGGMLRGADQIAAKLELAGQGILDARATSAQAAPAPSIPAGPSVTDQLRELAALHKEGVLTDEEFANAKSQLLGSG